MFQLSVESSEREKEVKRFRWLLLTGLVILLLGPGARAQCVTRTVAVEGDVIGLPPELKDAEVVVVLHTPSGDYSQTGTIIMENSMSMWILARLSRGLRSEDIDVQIYRPTSISP